jgi:hypothetical protein
LNASVLIVESEHLKEKIEILIGKIEVHVQPTDVKKTLPLSNTIEGEIDSKFRSDPEPNFQNRPEYLNRFGGTFQMRFLNRQNGKKKLKGN